MKQSVKPEITIEELPVSTKQYKVVLATSDYLVYVDETGTNAFINGNYSNLKPGDTVEL